MVVVVSNMTGSIVVKYHSHDYNLGLPLAHTKAVSLIFDLYHVFEIE